MLYGWGGGERGRTRAGKLTGQKKRKEKGEGVCDWKVKTYRKDCCGTFSLCTSAVMFSCVSVRFLIIDACFKGRGRRRNEGDGELKGKQKKKKKARITCGTDLRGELWLEESHRSAPESSFTALL